MSVTNKKIISPIKELFLALCLIGGEVSAITIKMLKDDYGDSYIKRNVVYNLMHKGYIRKIGIKSDYGYVLTEDGFNYLRIKCPHKYRYEAYCSSPSYIYKDSIRERNRRLTTVMYCLVKQGVSITNHYADICNIINHYNVKISETFFVTAKELRSTNERLSMCFGSRMYGCIVSPEGITVVYSPDMEHNLFLSKEEAFHHTLTDVLEYAKPPFNNQENLNTLYLYNNISDIKDSYEVDVSRIDKRVAQTRRAYKHLRYQNSYLNTLSNSSYEIKDVLFAKNKEQINKVFFDYFDLEPLKVTLETTFADGVYEDGVLTVINWTLNPKKMVQLMRYVLESRDKVLLLCFSEQTKIVDTILSVNKNMKNKVIVASLPRNDVVKYINGEIDEIE